METDARRSFLDSITKQVLGCAFTASNVLGCGFVEKVYENALALELQKTGLRAQQQHGVEVRYDGKVVGEFVADLLVEGQVLVELKAAKALDEAHTVQCLDYLKATGLPVCLLINFGKPRIEYKRIVRNF